MVIEDEIVGVLEGVIRNHHIYNETWDSNVGAIPAVLQKPGNLKLCLSRVTHLLLSLLIYPSPTCCTTRRLISINH